MGQSRRRRKARFESLTEQMVLNDIDIFFNGIISFLCEIEHEAEDVLDFDIYERINEIEEIEPLTNISTSISRTLIGEFER